MTHPAYVSQPSVVIFRHALQCLTGFSRLASVEHSDQPSPARSGVDAEAIRSGFAIACKKAEITRGQTKAGGITWHDLRHTFATRLRGEKVHELDIMQLLGHSSLGVTAGYAHGTPTVIQSAVDKLAEPRGQVVEFAQRAG